MPDDSIMDVVNNVEPLYNDAQGLYQKWYMEGDDWSKPEAKLEALWLAERFAETIGGDYGQKDIKDAAVQMLEEFSEFKKYNEGKLEEKKKAEAMETTLVHGWEQSAMTPGQIAHAKKNENLARAIGVRLLKEHIPASPEQIRKALENGDRRLTSIPLRKWDEAAAEIPVAAIITANPKIYGGDLSMSERVSLLKHVATWHYA